MIRSVFFLLAGVVLLAWAVPSQAATSNIDIRIIYAVKDKVNSVDPALDDIKGELQELPFSKFRLLDHLETKVQMNGTVELQFPGDRTIAVTFKGIDTSKGKKMLSLQVAIKPAAKIELRIADGGRAMFIGPTHKDGKLIVDVSAKLKEKGS